MENTAGSYDINEVMESMTYCKLFHFLKINQTLSCDFHFLNFFMNGTSSRLYVAGTYEGHRVFILGLWFVRLTHDIKGRRNFATTNVDNMTGFHFMAHDTPFICMVSIAIGALFFLERRYYYCLYCRQ